MEETINIRLGNYLLVLDLVAYEKVKMYLNLLQTKYAKTEEGLEIIADVEERLGEILDEKSKKEGRSYCNLADANWALAKMGPVSSEDENQAQSAFTEAQNSSKIKRLYRMQDDVVLGGVCSGLANYFNVDVVIVRAVFAILGLITGIGILAYFILYVSMPVAKTVGEKLQAKGIDPTSANIEQALRSGWNSAKSAGDALGKNSKKLATQGFSALSKVLLWVGSFFRICVVILACIVIFFLINPSTYFDVYYFQVVQQEGLNQLLSVFGNPLLVKWILIVLMVNIITIQILRVVAQSKKTLQLNKICLIINVINMLLILIMIVQISLDAPRSFRQKRTEQSFFTDSFSMRNKTLYIKFSGNEKELSPGIWAHNFIEEFERTPGNQLRIRQVNNAISSAAASSNSKRYYSFSNDTLILVWNQKIQGSDFQQTYFRIKVPKELEIQYLNKPLFYSPRHRHQEYYHENWKWEESENNF